MFLVKNDTQKVFANVKEYEEAPLARGIKQKRLYNITLLSSDRTEDELKADGYTELTKEKATEIKTGSSIAVRITQHGDNTDNSITKLNKIKRTLNQFEKYNLLDNELKSKYEGLIKLKEQYEVILKDNRRKEVNRIKEEEKITRLIEEKVIANNLLDSYIDSYMDKISKLTTNG